MIVEDGRNYKYQKNYIKKNINSKHLLEKYNADNILYIFYFNTPYSNSVKPRTFRHTSDNLVEVDRNIVDKMLIKSMFKDETYLEMRDFDGKIEWRKKKKEIIQ